jgi:predicted sulfurtransferase
MRITRHLLAMALLAAIVGLIVACESTPEPVGSVHSDGVRRVTPEQAKTLLDQDRAVLVDTRGSLAFMGARASGAILAPAAEIYQDPVGVFANVPQDKELILYCT